jgi:DNA polymerase I-like protein with 3'-5' exonuclease and polymerase domains
MKAAGLTNRDQAKTFIYAFLYGAGPAKIGQIVGGGEREGRKLIDSFLANTPALHKLKEKVNRLAQKNWLPGLDGRRLIIRSQHAALNTLLQGAGAVVMKQALIHLTDELKSCKILGSFVANVHDEWQIETSKEFAESVGQLGVQAIQQAGLTLGLRCPLDGEYKIGSNWATTH